MRARRYGPSRLVCRAKHATCAQRDNLEKRLWYNEAPIIDPTPVAVPGCQPGMDREILLQISPE